MKTRCLGRLPHDPAQVAALPPLDRYLSTFTGAIPGPLPDWTRDIPPGDWGMYGNDEIGDCTAAGIAHAKLTWGVYTAPYTAMADPDGAVDLYSGATGYVRGQPSTDRGARCTDMLMYCHRNVVNGDKLSAFATINPRRHDHIEMAIRVFGGVYVGATMRQANMSQPVWDVRDGNQTSIGGHCFWVPKPLSAITWGTEIGCTLDWWDACVEEVYAILSPRWVLGGHTPAGLAADEMIKDMMAITD